MEETNLTVISKLTEWLDRQQNCWLCTVIITWGSSPRMPGSLMACNDQGIVAGSLSGGCIEDELVSMLVERRIATDHPIYKIYGEDKREAERLKLPCGGSLGILIEPFLQKDIYTSAHSHFKNIENALSKRLNIQSRREWHTAIFTSKPTNKSATIDFKKNDEDIPLALTQVYGPTTHLIIIGICDVARYLAEFALVIGCKVSICDPREKLTEQWHINNTQLLTGMPDEIVQTHAMDSHCAIVAVSHDPRVDDMALMVAFDTPAFYIGAMGSMKSSENRRQRLQQLGINQQQLKRLKAPIGLDIKSKTPAEIAIAIIADIIDCRNKS